MILMIYNINEMLLSPLGLASENFIHEQVIYKH